MAPPLRLYTIGFSHFCEKARWALDRAELAYEERDHPAIFHFAPNLLAGAKRTVPALVTPDGVLGESSEIIRFADEHVPPERRLFPEEPTLRAEVERWVAHLDRKLGPATRRVFYFHQFSDQARARTLLASTGSTWERQAARLLAPALQALMRRGMKIDAAGAARSQAALEAVFSEVAVALADGRRYLVGDRFTAADLTFAALAGPAVPALQYGFTVPEAALAPAVQAWRAEMGATPAGRFALEMFAQERPPVRAQGRSDLPPRTG
jgi:glutathione S-transferase